MVSLETLLQRVPDLPTADDLALTLPAVPDLQEPIQPEAPAFELDLGTFDEPPIQAQDPADWPTQPLPGIEPVPAVPVPDVEAVEMDLADLQDVFEEAGTALPEPATSPPQELDETPPSFEATRTLHAEDAWALPDVDLALSVPVPLPEAEPVSPDLVLPFLATGAAAEMCIRDRATTKRLWMT